MSSPLARFVSKLAAFAAVLVLGSAPASAFENGQFQAGLYTAPRELFTVRSPLGPNPWVIDSFDHSAGAVTFVDEQGGLFGVICTPNFDVLAGAAKNDAETDIAILRNWLHDATFPLFFERQLPGAAILQEGAATFDGRPAWIGVMQLPHGSSMFRNDPETGLPVRLDSYRGLVVFSRGDHTYLIMTEVDPQLAWNSFLPKLSEFYRGITFRSPDAPLVLQTFADIQDAGN
jgi:hypothetical protein